MMNPEVRRILEIVADLSQYDVKKDVLESSEPYTFSQLLLSACTR
jgi:hypothetical protein